MRFLGLFNLPCYDRAGHFRCCLPSSSARRELCRGMTMLLGFSGELAGQFCSAFHQRCVRPSVPNALCLSTRSRAFTLVGECTLGPIQCVNRLSAGVPGRKSQSAQHSGCGRSRNRGAVDGGHAVPRLRTSFCRTLEPRRGWKAEPMWWWRKVRKVTISKVERNIFEQYGETVVALIVVNQLSGIGNVLVNRTSAEAWLTERADIHERREDRLETVEWAVLIFVIVGVIVDVLLLVRGH